MGAEKVVKMGDSSLNLPFPSWTPYLSPMMTFLLVAATYIFVAGGIPYCIISDMPFMGTAVDDRGRQRQQAIATGHGQYIAEGLTVGFFLTLGGLGLVILDRMNRLVSPSRMTRLLVAGIGISAIVGSVLALRTILGIKVHWYLQHPSW